MKSTPNPNDPCFDWTGLILEGWPSKIEVSWVLGINSLSFWPQGKQIYFRPTGANLARPWPKFASSQPWSAKISSSHTVDASSIPNNHRLGCFWSPVKNNLPGGFTELKNIGQIGSFPQVSGWKLKTYFWDHHLVMGETTNLNWCSPDFWTINRTRGLVQLVRFWRSFHSHRSSRQTRVIVNLHLDVPGSSRSGSVGDFNPIYSIYVKCPIYKTIYIPTSWDIQVSSIETSIFFWTEKHIFKSRIVLISNTHASSSTKKGMTLPKNVVLYLLYCL